MGPRGSEAASRNMSLRETVASTGTFARPFSHMDCGCGAMAISSSMSSIPSLMFGGGNFLGHGAFPSWVPPELLGDIRPQVASERLLHFASTFSALLPRSACWPRAPGSVPGIPPTDVADSCMNATV